MTPSRTAQYKATIAKLKLEYKGKVDILCGLEWDQFSDDKRIGYDYWIGSVHYLRGPKTGRYYEIDWRPQDLKDCMDNDFGGDGLAMAEAYFASVAEVAAQKPDILGHFDLIKKLNCTGAYFDENAPRYKAAALAALNVASEADCLLEVNTGGVYRGYRSDFYPSFWLLEEWRKRDGKVIITADAHNTESLTFGYEDAAGLLRSAGFEQVQVLTGSGFVAQEL
jgi:histidinol-phosphatase (PHP family)